MAKRGSGRQRQPNRLTETTAPKVAWVLPGAGGRGPFQGGLVRALDEAGAYPDIIVAAGAGAINALVYATGGSANIEEFWMASGRHPRVPSISFRHNPVVGRSLFPTGRLYSRVEAHLDFESLVCTTTEIDLAVLNLSTGHTEFHTNTSRAAEAFRESSRASYTLPLVHPARQIDESEYAMQPLAGQCLIDRARARGATDIYVAQCFATAPVPENNLASFTAVGARVYDLLHQGLAHLTLPDHVRTEWEAEGLHVTDLAPRSGPGRDIWRELWRGPEATARLLASGLTEGQHALRRQQRQQTAKIVPLRAPQAARH